MSAFTVTHSQTDVEHVATPGEATRPLCGAENSSGLPWHVLGRAGTPGRTIPRKPLCVRCREVVTQLRDLAYSYPRDDAH